MGICVKLALPFKEGGAVQGHFHEMQARSIVHQGMWEGVEGARMCNKLVPPVQQSSVSHHAKGVQIAVNMAA